jgi:hypothetical protein
MPVYRERKAPGVRRWYYFYGSEDEAMVETLIGVGIIFITVLWIMRRSLDYRPGTKNWAHGTEGSGYGSLSLSTRLSKPSRAWLLT